MDDDADKDVVIPSEKRIEKGLYMTDTVLDELPWNRMMKKKK